MSKFQNGDVIAKSATAEPHQIVTIHGDGSVTAVRLWPVAPFDLSDRPARVRIGADEIGQYDWVDEF
jgi:hypothetical protein